MMAAMVLVGCGERHATDDSVPAGEARKLSGIWENKSTDGDITFTYDLRDDGSGSRTTQFHNPLIAHTKSEQLSYSWDGDEIVIQSPDGHKTWYSVESNGDLLSSGFFNAYHPDKGRLEHVGGERKRWRKQE